MSSPADVAAENSANSSSPTQLNPVSPKHAEQDDSKDKSVSELAATSADEPDANPSPSAAETSEKEEGETEDDDSSGDDDDGRGPNAAGAAQDASSAAPPLPNEHAPSLQDDGWEYHWNPNTSSYWFYNRNTGVWQQENPRISTEASKPQPDSANPPLPSSDALAMSAPGSIAGGYNPAIHGDYDPNAWYAQAGRATEEEGATAAHEIPADYVGGGYFNKSTGAWQLEEQGPANHSDESKSRRQLNAFFDVDAAANAHDGRSLKAERSGKKPTKTELKAFKEKRRARKEEKRRAWLRD